MILDQIRQALGVSDHGPLDSNNERHPFCCRSHPKMGNFENKNQHRATAAATVAVAVVAQIVVSCSKNGRARGAVREPPDLQIDSQICGV